MTFFFCDVLIIYIDVDEVSAGLRKKARSCLVFSLAGLAESSEDICTIKMGVSKNRGTPKRMVYNGKPY